MDLHLTSPPAAGVRTFATTNPLLPWSLLPTLHIRSMSPKASASRRRRPEFALGVPIAYPRTILLSLSWLLLSLIGLVCFSLDQARSGSMGCEMSWMSPTYHRLEWDQSTEQRYSVYLYREGGLDPAKVSGALGT